MMQSLTIGLCGPSPGWQMLLDQMGAPYRLIQDFTGVQATAFAVIIAAAPLTASRQEALIEYVREGGMVLDMRGEVFRRLQRHHRRQLWEETASILKHIDLIDLFSRIFAILTGRLPGKGLKVETPGGGMVIYLALPLDRLMLTTRPRREPFYSPAGTRFPNERVVRISKGALFRVAQALLISLFKERGLPLVHRWYFPHGARNLFAFRIDSDFATPEQVRAWYELGRRHHLRFTWFLHAAAHESWLDVFREFEGHEMAVHGYRHYTYRSYRRNYQNLSRGRELLRQQGFEPEGVAAPYGLWYPALARAQEALGFAYASEFSLGYDTFPFFPFVDGRFSPVLQVPIHPICIGSLIRAGYSEAEMEAYFRHVVQRKLGQWEPIILYDHPLHPHRAVLDRLFEWMAELELPNLTLGEYARWWKLRRRSPLQASVTPEGVLAVQMEEAPVKVAVWRDYERMALVDGSGEYAPETLSWEGPASAPPLDRERAGRMHRYTPRLILQSILDTWWRWKKSAY